MKAVKVGFIKDKLIQDKTFIEELMNIQIIGLHVYMGSQILGYKTIYNNFNIFLNLQTFV
jgi:diaminopimelate decarboxylase